MNLQQFAAADDRLVRRYGYGDRTTIAVDLGADAGRADVDVVGSTAIVVVETADGPRETEIELPSAEATAAVRNGVLTVEVPK